MVLSAESLFLSGCWLGRFSFTIRRKCRQYRQRQTPALLRHLRSNHKCFWQQLNRAEGALPAPLASHAARDAFHQRLCAPPATRMRPPDNPCPVSPPSCAALEADISQREVEQALPKLSNGKASGGAGWPAELLRHAAEYITMDNGSRQKVWILAPLLTRLLNRCFRSGIAAALHCFRPCDPDPQEGLHPGHSQLPADSCG